MSLLTVLGWDPWLGPRPWITTWLILALCACPPTPLSAAYQRGVRLEAAGQDTQALAAYRAAARDCHHDSAACRLCHLRRAETLTRLGQQAQAVQAYLQLPRWTADHALAAKSLARAAELLQRHLGLALWDQLTQEYPHSPLRQAQQKGTSWDCPRDESAWSRPNE